MRDANRYLIARDPIGVMPLYTGRDAHGTLYVASEMKALMGVCQTVEDFPPGHYLDSEVGEIRRYYQPAWRDHDAVAGRPFDIGALRHALDAAVERQLMWRRCRTASFCRGPRLVDHLGPCAAPQQEPRGKRRADTGVVAPAPLVRDRSAGVPRSGGGAGAAQAIGTIHHELHFTLQEGLDAIPDVIHHIETYDVTTVRASTPIYLLARRIKSVGIKMVFTGEGSDEVFGGYLYFHKAPNAREFHEETVRKLDMLYKYELPAGQQVHGRVGHRSAGPVPRSRVPRRGDELRRRPTRW